MITTRVGAVVQGALFLPRRTDGADDAGAGFHGKLRGEQADAPANGVDEHRLPGLEAVERMQHVVAGHRLNDEGGADVKRNRVGQRHQNVGGSDRLFGIGAALFHEGRDAVADLHAADARAELRDRAGNLKTQDQRIGERVRIDAGADLRIRPVAAGECNIDQDLARAGSWFG